MGHFETVHGFSWFLSPFLNFDGNCQIVPVNACIQQSVIGTFMTTWKKDKQPTTDGVGYFFKHLGSEDQSNREASPVITTTVLLSTSADCKTSMIFSINTSVKSSSAGAIFFGELK